MKIEDKIKDLESKEPIKPKYLFWKLLHSQLYFLIILSIVLFSFNVFIFGFTTLPLVMIQITLFMIMFVFVLIVFFSFNASRNPSKSIASFKFGFKIAGIMKFMEDYNKWYYKLERLKALKEKKDEIERIENL